MTTDLKANLKWREFTRLFIVHYSQIHSFCLFVWGFFPSDFFFFFNTSNLRTMKRTTHSLSETDYTCFKKLKQKQLQWMMVFHMLRQHLSPFVLWLRGKRAAANQIKVLFATNEVVAAVLTDNYGQLLKERTRPDSWVAIMRHSRRAHLWQD